MRQNSYLLPSLAKPFVLSKNRKKVLFPISQRSKLSLGKTSLFVCKLILSLSHFPFPKYQSKLKLNQTPKQHISELKYVFFFFLDTVECVA